MFWAVYYIIRYFTYRLHPKVLTKAKISIPAIDTWANGLTSKPLVCMTNGDSSINEQIGTQANW
jgi:hypothetical protein